VVPLCAEEYVVTHHSSIDFPFRIQLVSTEHSFSLEIAEQHIVVLGTYNEDCIMHFVNDADQLLLLLLDNSAFQEQAALFEFQSAS
jgi:hypothetical protein